VLEYVEDEIEIRSDYPAPPNHASLAPGDPILGRSEVDLIVTSDTDVPFPRSGEAHATLPKRFRREATAFAADLATPPQNNPPHPRHPLAQSYVLSSPDPAHRPEPHHLVVPHLVPRTPSPPHTVLASKREHGPTPEEDNDTGNSVGPSAAAVDAPSQIEARSNEDSIPRETKAHLSPTNLGLPNIRERWLHPNAPTRRSPDTRKFPRALPSTRTQTRFPHAGGLVLPRVILDPNQTTRSSVLRVTYDLLLFGVFRL